MSVVETNTLDELEKSQYKKVKKLNIDISNIIQETKNLYSKKDKGVADQISTGTTIPRPTKDSDFIVWTGGPHWRALTGIKGIPFGSIVQIAGKTDSGKSSHAMVFMRDAQAQGHVVILWDTEKKFSAKRFANKMGGNPDDLIVINTNNIIEGAKAIANTVNTLKAKYPEIKILIVWDSVGASINSSEDSDDDEDFSKQPGITAKENAWAIRKFAKLAHKHRNKETGEESIAILLVNQVYANIGSVGHTEKGGSEIAYLSSIILQLSRKSDLTRTKAGEKYKYGIVTRAKVKKNHLFEGDETIAELDLVISASGVHLAKDIKSHKDLEWNNDDNDD